MYALQRYMRGWRDGVMRRDNRLESEDYKRGFEDGRHAAELAYDLERARLCGEDRRCG